MACRTRYLSACRVLSMEELRRERWRASYARRYPAGFKRRRNAEQTARQRAAQRTYREKTNVGIMRKMHSQVRQYLEGKCRAPHIADIVGCTPEQLEAHLRATAEPSPKWHLSYRKPPREFELEREQDTRDCFHFSNLYAKSVHFNCAGASLFPSQLAPSQANQSHAVRIVSV